LGPIVSFLQKLGLIVIYLKIIL